MNVPMAKRTASLRSVTIEDAQLILVFSDHTHLPLDIPAPYNEWPPGWDSVRALFPQRPQTEFSAIAAAWDDEGTNSIAEHFAAAIQATYIDRMFHVDPAVLSFFLVPGASSTAVVRVTPQVGALSVLYGGTQILTAADLSDEMVAICPGLIRLQFGGGVPALDLIAPHSGDARPTNWWLLETLTGIPSENVVKGWDEAMVKNPVLLDVAKRFDDIAKLTQVPVREGGVLDASAWRKALVRTLASKGRKPILYAGRRPSETAEVARKFLRDLSDSTFFVAGYDPGVSSGQLAVLQRMGGKRGLRHYDPSSISDRSAFRALLMDYLDFARPGKPPHFGTVPMEIVEKLLHEPDKELPTIQDIVRIPTLRPDGSVLQTPGYDSATRLWYEPDFDVPPINPNPSDREIQEAREFILTPYKYFPFESECDRTVAVAAPFDQFALELIGHRPHRAIVAPVGGQGSGKSLLANTIHAAILGRTSNAGQVSKSMDDEEMKKFITAQLKAGSRVIFLDNMKGERGGIISYAALDQLATTHVWGGRLLGGNEMGNFANNALVLITVNDGRFDKDSARRMILCRLNAGPGAAHKRAIPFDAPNPPTWNIANRPRVIHAYMTLVSAWLARGRPTDPARPRLGNFEQWCDVVGGLCHVAGLPGFADALDVASYYEELREDLSLLYEQWYALIQVDPSKAQLQASELGALAKEHQLFAREEAWHTKTAAIALGKAMGKILRQALGVEIRPWGRLVKSARPGAGNRHTYWLERTQPQPAPAPAPVSADDADSALDE
jgi:hypothetical protein